MPLNPCLTFLRRIPLNGESSSFCTPHSTQESWSRLWSWSPPSNQMSRFSCATNQKPVICTRLYLRMHRGMCLHSSLTQSFRSSQAPLSLHLLTKRTVPGEVVVTLAQGSPVVVVATQTDPPSPATVTVGGSTVLTTIPGSTVLATSTSFGPPIVTTILVPPGGTVCILFSGDLGNPKLTRFRQSRTSFLVAFLPQS
jgi:hypothetical protein